jgi:hypothetical protein
VTEALEPPAVPVRISPADGQRLHNRPRTITLRWRRIRGASYDIQVDCFGCRIPAQWDGENGEMWQTTDALRQAKYQLTFPGDNAGRWRVRSSKGGLKSDWSPWWHFSFQTGARPGAAAAPTPTPGSSSATAANGNTAAVAPSRPAPTPITPESAPAASSPPPAISTPRPTAPAATAARPPQQDCIRFNPQSLRVEFINGRWKITDGSRQLFDFEYRQVEARRALTLMRFYRMDQSCFVGRPRSKFRYLLSQGQAPRGGLEREDCIDFAPQSLRAIQVGGRWKIAEGAHQLFDFGDSAENASRALEIIRHHQFRKACFVGRPAPSFQYLRR